MKVRDQGHKVVRPGLAGRGIEREQDAHARSVNPSAAQVLWVDSLEMEHLGMESANPRSMGSAEFAFAESGESGGGQSSASQEPV